VGISISFTLNRYYNFRVKNKTALRYLSFFSVGMCGLALSEAMLLFGGNLGIDPFSTKLVSVVIVACFQFTLNKLISFRKSKPKNAEECSGGMGSKE
jgi:putative flippase GtrA